MKFLFLDFDGVLHSHSGHSSALWTFLPRLESVLRDCAEAQVVVSSSWGDRRNVDELRAFFSNDIQPRIIDKVATELRGLHGDSDRAMPAVATADAIGSGTVTGSRSTITVYCSRTATR